ncbi:AAA family ATPase [Nitrincola alkalilacustris]|uniref:AAA family ATPase n=1 Tax=Nitrincola alkalilacustris TaxID=1571224 RepID=UPI00124E1C92|nr:AAA family ATPase [Nitrincola alkalilacustris]
MSTLAGYRILECLHQGGFCRISRALCLADGAPVIIKQLDRQLSSHQRLSRLQHEYEILQGLDLPDLPQTLGQITLETGPATLFFDSGAVPLRQLLSGEARHWTQWLQLAIRIAELLGRLHEAHIIHKQISPDHILVHPQTGSPKLIDFSLSTRLSHEQAHWFAPDLAQMNLTYIAPEQTGRINRSIDYRTDYYSFGVTLYEVLTGQPPFISQESLEQVHNQIAKQPIPPHILNPKIPERLSRILLKLLAKDAAQRYQSSIGLVHDLQQCLQLEHSPDQQLPPLGEQDISARFQIPQKLYGRESMLEKLQQRYDQTATGKRTLTLISGYAGVGKSSLVLELRQYVNERGGSFSSGKFDQFRRNRPYFAIIQALQSLVRQLLTEPQPQIDLKREQLLSALGRQAQVLLRLIPELELIIGPQPESPVLLPAEEQNRFSRLFVQMLRVLSSAEKPLVLFMDDLHWADLASLYLLEHLVLIGDLSHLMLIVSYRDQEVNAGHPLRTILSRLEQSSYQSSEQIVSLSLTPLDLQQVNHLLADTLLCRPDQCRSLAVACLQKTQGNPFFLNQFLHSLYQEGMITFREQRWQWDEAAIRVQEMTDNVIELMVSKFQRLPVATQRVLPLAACIGSVFNLRILSLVSTLHPDQTARDLWPALTEGLVVPQDDSSQLFQHIDPARSRYRFVHDRVQQAAYSLISESDLEALHLQIGKQLLKSLNEEEQESRLFEIANHLNQARRLVTEPEERLSLAQLNLRAGLRARETAAFDSALDYLLQGLALLPVDAWLQHYALTLNLHTAAADLAHIKSDQGLMDQLMLAVETNAHDLLDKVRLYEIRIQSQVARNRFDKALKIALDLLDRLGVKLREKPGKLYFWRALARTHWLLRQHTEEQILSARKMQSPQLLAAMPILASMFGVIKFSSSELRPLVMAKEVELSLVHGLNPASAMAFAGYGGVLCGQFNAIEQGYKLGQLAIKLDLQYPAPLTYPRTLVLFNTYIRHYREPLRLCLESLLRAHQLALDCGDMEWSAYALAAYIQYAFPLSQNLNEIQPALEQYTELLRQSGQEQSLQYSLFTLQIIDNLTEQNSNPLRLDGRFYSEERDLAELKRENHRTAICLHHFYKGLLCYLLGEAYTALRHCLEGEKLLSSIGGTFTAPWLKVVTALCRLSLLPKLSGLNRYRELKHIRRTLRHIRELAGYSPDNHQHHYHLLQAELLKARRRPAQALTHYEEAIRTAREKSFVLEEALACELAGQFCLDWQKPAIAHSYLMDAYRLFGDWGATAKQTQMRRHYGIAPAIIEAPAADQSVDDALHSGNFDTHSFDITSVIQASQAISDEIVLEKLLGRLMQLALQNAGAQRGLLILKRQQQLYIEAEASLDAPYRTFNNLALEAGSDHLPLTIIHYVARTKENLVLGNAVAHQMFQQDEYIRRHRPHSLLCIPILYHGDLTAILYLEHGESRDIFNRDRLKTLQILASQAAISIENAKLYQSLEQSEQEYRSLFENAIEGIFRVDAQGRFISANPALVRLLGYDSSEHFIQSVTDVTRQCFQDPEECRRFLKILSQDNHILNFETRWLRHNGDIVFVSISARRLLNEQSELIYYEGSLTDISERKAKEAAELAREKAEAASEAKSQFLATMSHEIRTPMNGVLGMAQLLLRSPLTPEQKEQVEAIYRSGSSLLSILNDVLDFTKIEAGQMPLEVSDFDLPAILRDLHQLLLPTAHQQSLDFILRLDPNLPERVRGDARALNQILLNLCTNALKFTESGYVVLKARLIEDSDLQLRCHFEVEDSGIGIPESAHPRLFQHFSQADSSITRRFGGTGLGLSICKRLVELQQGNIGFSSRPQVGSRFWFELSYEQPVSAPEQATPLIQAVVSKPDQPLDILLVEDNEINQQVTAGLLRSEGHQVSIADDGYTALSMHNDRDYDLVLMDIHLPDMDGIETTRRIRQHPKSFKRQVRIIALTASVTPTEMRQYLEAGMNAVISKPFQFEELRRLLNNGNPSPAPLQASSDPVLLNQSLLQQHRQQLGQELFEQLMQKMKLQSEQFLEELCQPDISDQRRTHLLHTLAGSFSNFGLCAAAEKAKALEHKSQPSTDQLSDLKKLFDTSLSSLQESALTTGLSTQQ